MVMTWCPHNDCQAVTTNTNLKRFLDRERILTRLLLFFLPMRHAHMHHTFGVQFRTPVVRQSHRCFILIVFCAQEESIYHLPYLSRFPPVQHVYSALSAE